MHTNPNLLYIHQQYLVVYNLGRGLSLHTKGRGYLMVVKTSSYYADRLNWKNYWYNIVLCFCRFTLLANGYIIHRTLFQAHLDILLSSYKQPIWVSVHNQSEQLNPLIFRMNITP